MLALGRRRPAATLAAACLLAVASAVSVTEREYPLIVEASSCQAVPVTFQTRYFQYYAGFTTGPQLPAGCTVQISRLYMDGVCSTQRNNEGTGCSGGGGGSSVNGSSEACLAVLTGAPGAWEDMTNTGTSLKTFDQGSYCAATNRGYFYVSNGCAQDVPFSLVLRTYAYPSCGTTGGFPAWGRIIIGICCGLVAMVLFTVAFRRCGGRNRTSQPPMAVQMAPPGGQQAGGYGYGGAYGGATSGPPAGYPTNGAGQAGYPSGPAGYPPTQQASYAGAWGSTGAAYGATPGYAGGPPAGYPPQFIPPMQTVVVGAPADEPGGGSSDSYYPRPGGGPGAGAGAGGQPAPKV